MKPNFALSLSFDGIRLLHRQPGGWGRVGDVDLGTADLAGDLTALRSAAEALSDGPVQTKLIIPDEQIKYLTVDATGLDKSSLQDAVMQALDGATPYAVEDLAFDFAPLGQIVHIAAVAKETLAEAEAFAVDHEFAPMGFVAAPSAHHFPKEPNFGASALAHAQGITALQSDAQPAVMTGEATPPPAALASTPSPEPAPEIAPEIAPAPDAPATGFSSRRTEPGALANASPEATPAAPAPVLSTEGPSQTAAPRLQGVSRSPADAAGPLERVELPPVSSAPLDRAATAPPITGTPAAAVNPDEARLDMAAMRPGAADAYEDDVPDMPAFVAKPRSAAPAVPAAAAGVLRGDIAIPNDGPSAADRAASLAKGAGAAALAGAAKFLSKRAKPAPVPAPAPAAQDAALPQDADPREAEKNRLTVFGARKPKKAKPPIPIGGKPRFLGLILTAILLLFLVSVAAWASVFLDDGIARFFGGDKRDRAIAELASPEELAEQDSDVQLAALDDGSVDLTLEDGTAPTGLSQVAPPPVLSPEEAEARYAATGIWQASPVQPPLPRAIALEDVYIPSIDGKISGEDAIALLGPDQREDAQPGSVQAPAPAGTTFDIDDNGFVRATPEGASTPEGAVVYSGRPAVVPPAVPQRLLQPAETPEGEGTEPAADAAPAPLVTAASRPRLRPDSLVEDTERTQLGGNTRAELSRLRPQLRPRVEKQAEEEVAQTAPPTAQAVATSRKPGARPSNFANIVTRAQRNQQRQQEQQQEQATQVAAVAPRTVTPSIPSAASVSRAATQKNAINLSRVNLIGVYGKPSSRRALVRLSSGRYKKVKVGDRVDGGRVSAIGETQLNYTKGGRSITLRMPKG